jgi:class 3 adenylate cyclase/tetratricopeptide (TPR) repeat protein
MRCSKCAAENREGRKFCAACGSSLASACPKCGASNLPGEQFCGECGASLNAPASTPADATPSIPVPEVAGERRHLTILFCDLVGSTTLAAQVDPEEWQAIVADYQRAAAAAITGFGGEVVRYIGDGIMAFFGYPLAHDNDAERAVRAGLAILDAIAERNQQSEELSVRIGIDSGTVVVGTGEFQAVDAFGDAANIAARVQAAAEPGTVMISDATQRLVAGLFVVEDRSAQALKGIAQPVRLYRIIRPSGMRGRFEAVSKAGGLTPFVGREDELRSLLSRWERALDGEGQVALIIGEAGIGKSRLLQRFHESITGTPHTWIEAGAGAFFQNTPFYPISEMLRQLLGDSVPHDPITALASRLMAVGLKPLEAVPLIAPLLNLSLPPEYPPSPLSREQQRRRLLATLVEWVIGSARVQPLVSVVEDLHWIDPSTLELIQLFVEQGRTARLLLLYTARPEFRAPWAVRAHHTQITLNRLSAHNVRTMVGEVAAQKALSDETIATVVERTGGVPLFVEELTRAVLESSDAKLSGSAIPATLHDSLMARLDRLGPPKEVIQVGAVIGSEFSYELLHAVHRIAEADLQRALRTLTDAELLYVRGIAPEATYQFKHALIRDAAYEALLKTRRKELHLIVARTLDEKFPAIKEAHPEVLARHWAEAGETESAVAEWSRAGKAAQERNAFSEARESYQQALALLNPSPESAERDLRELELWQSIYLMVRVTRGYTAPETIDAIEHVAVLAERTGNLQQQVISVRSRGHIAFFAGDLLTAIKLGDQALELAAREGSHYSLALAHSLQLQARYFRGDLAGAEHHFAEGLNFFGDPGLRQFPGAATGPFSFASLNVWLLGRSDTAAARMAQMVAIANKDNPYDVAFSAYFPGALKSALREYDQAAVLAEQALELSEKHQFPDIAALSRCLLGYARAHLGRATEGVGLIRDGVADLLKVGARLGPAGLYPTYLAVALEREGSTAEALKTIEQALRGSSEALYYRPESLRIRGGLHLKQGGAAQAETDFRQAIQLARSMSAKAWELRAAMSLARLLASQGNRDEARAMLVEIYKWFTEGFDTADLKDAKALLDELSL